MATALPIAVGAGSLSALGFLASLSGLPGALLVVYFASLPLMMAGLTLGPRAVAIAGATGAVLCGLAGNGVVAALFALGNAVPAWLVTRQALLQSPGGAAGDPRSWYPPGSILCGLALFAAGILLAAGVAVQLGGEGGFRAAIAGALDEVFQTMAPDLAATDRTRAVEFMIPVFPGSAGTSWVLMLVINGVLAQGLVARMGRNLRPVTRFVELTLPQWASWPLVLAAAAALVGSGDLEYLGRNLAMVLATPFFFLGLAVVHVMARRSPLPGVVLAVFYVVVLFSVWSAMAVAGIGLIEQWVGLRRRFAGPSGPGGPATGNGS